MTTRSASAQQNHSLEQLFPDDAVTVVDVRYCGDQAAPPLAPELVPLVSKAVEGRRREFAYGRCCASLALDAIGSRGRVVGRGPDRAPLWPTGAIGSISHTAGYAVAVAASHLPARGLGIDAERRGAIGDDIVPHVLTAAEGAHLLSIDASRRPELTTVAFSAKEALFKAQYPLTGSWVGFDEVQIESIRSQAQERGGTLLLVPATHGVVRDCLIWPVTAHWILVGDIIVVGVSVSLRTTGASHEGNRGARTNDDVPR